MATYLQGPKKFQQPSSDAHHAASRPRHTYPQYTVTGPNAYTKPPKKQLQQFSKPDGKEKSNDSKPPPPFNGPPPLPAGISVNPQQWQAGYWQYNPTWNQKQNPKQQHVPWIPSHHWIPQYNNINNQQTSSASQQQEQHNPYKRVPRPPSAEYLATQLVDNPLGLSGLDEPNKYYDQVQTPWVWRPRDLDDEDDEDEDNPSPEHNSTDSPSQSRKNSDNATPNTEETEYFTSKRELQPTFSINIVRTPDHYRRHSSGSNPSTPSRNSRDSRNNSNDGWLSTISPESTGASVGSQPLTLDSEGLASSGPILGDQISDEPSSMLSPLLIAQTPKPGTSPLRGLRAHFTHPLIGSGGLEPIPETTTNSAKGAYSTPTKPKERRSAPVGHSSSLPSITGSQLYAGSAQPSPYREPYDKERDRKDKEKKERMGVGSRHTTFIEPYATMPNGYISGYANPAPHPSSPATPSSHTHSTPSSRHSSSSLPSPPSPHHPSNQASPPSSYSPRQSPPRKAKYSPPEDPHYNKLHQHSPAVQLPAQQQLTALSTPFSKIPPPPPPPTPSSTTMIVPKISLPPPPQLQGLSAPTITPRSSLQPHETRRRRGFWNRRGDHLTQSGYVVLAPPDKRFPYELRTYPAEDEGYEKHDGTFTAFVPSRAELPESLPRNGKPESPYESFVIYEPQ